MNEEDIKNLSEIIELCEEEINNNNENVTAILDLEDLKSLRNLINRNKELEKELKELEETLKDNWEFRDRFYIQKSKLKGMKGIIYFLKILLGGNKCQRKKRNN